MLTKLYRPGYFGRRRDAIVTYLNNNYGKGSWTIVWSDGEVDLEFEYACVYFYQASYLDYFRDRPDELDFVCSFGECIDNAPTNVQSGCDYNKQEAFSTHIQDIAVRNVLRIYGRKFEGPADKILVIRSADSEGFKYGPGNIDFWNPAVIMQPSKCPTWACLGSVEDFWQSNKWIALRDG